MEPESAADIVTFQQPASTECTEGKDLPEEISSKVTQQQEKQNEVGHDCKVADGGSNGTSVGPRKTTVDDEREQLTAYLADLNEKLKQKQQLRAANKSAVGNRPEEAFFSKLDSSLKKNTAFVRKLKTISENQREALIKDLGNLNLSKYISEAAAAIVEAKLKMSDISTAIQICSLLHQRYADFSGQLMEHWHKVLPFKKEDKISNLSKLRVDLRFFAELIATGVFTVPEGFSVLKSLLTFLMNNDKEQHKNINILLSFLKHCGEEFAEFIPRRIQALARKYQIILPSNSFLPEDKQKCLQGLFRDYFKSVTKHLVKAHKNFQALEKLNRRQLQMRGELSNEQKEKYEAAGVAFQKLLHSAEQFADTIDEDLPQFPKEEVTVPDVEENCIDLHNRYIDGDVNGKVPLWEDEDTREFYENFPDLKALESGSRSNVPAVIHISEVPSLPDRESSDKLPTEDTAEDFENKSNSDGVGEDISVSLQQEVEATEEETAEDEASTSASNVNKLEYDKFAASLLHCVNREMVDLAAEHFILNLNSKPNRKKLVKTLFLVPRTRFDLLPFYSRLVASLNPCIPDIAAELVTLLKQDFKFHMKKKDQINLESKNKTVRFIGELVKFNVFLKSEALYFLKMLLFDFTHHNIEMACSLLETCGRYLYRSYDSHYRTKIYLDQMMRKKAVQALDSRYITMIENAFYYCNPPETASRDVVTRPPMHEYICKLLYKDLHKNNTEKILRQIRKLDWEDEEISAFATRCLTEVWNVRYYNIRCIANLLAGLVAYQETIGLHVVDGVLEEIRLGMEVNHPKYNQRRVSTVHYLGELYNYRLVESAVIFRVLYSFISFGVNYDGTPTELDPPENLFRIRLVCILLETCAQYFSTGSSRRKLDCFLVFFQRYFWQKKCLGIFTDDYPFTVNVDFRVRDTITNLRPSVKLYESLDESVEAVQALLAELKPKLSELIPNFSLSSVVDNKEAVPESNDALGPIQEEDEEIQDDAPEAAINPQSSEIDNDTDTQTGSQSQPLEFDSDTLSIPGDVDKNQTITSEEEGGHSFDDDMGVTFVTSGPAHIPCQEDDDFMTAFDKMLSESIQHRSQDSTVKPSQADIVLPLNFRGSSQKSNLGLPTRKWDSRQNPTNTMGFVLMTRKGNKPQFKNLEVPVQSDLAQNLKDQEKAEKAEKEQVKRLTLNMNRRQEEEDYQEMLASLQRPATVMFHRERRRFQQPKVAPDGDAAIRNKRR